MDTSNPSKDSPKDPEMPKTEKEKKEEHFYKRWENPGHNKMGNDITGDMKVANSNGDLEGGRDKRWHLEDDDQE